ncbi:MAG: phage holin family protein [Verrucomicrobia bacterium]|nr:phage holin family protein [Verrucomicrobiota bacterium]MBU1736316.1 phage holin family protein [Verrucomicrobiota bacterium]MBU1857530.1 phage holin family protein [Verrucomicrobiota bacterium]
MLGTIVRWLILTLAVWVAAHLIPGIAYDHWQNLLIAALVLGILNAFVKPIILLISLPLIFITFGFFLVLINALLLKATAWLVPGLHVASFWSALGGSLVVSIVSLFFGYSRVRSDGRDSGVGIPTGRD